MKTSYITASACFLLLTASAWAAKADIEKMDKVAAFMERRYEKGLLKDADSPFAPRGLTPVKIDDSAVFREISKKITAGGVLRRGDVQYVIVGEKKLKENDEADIAVDGKTHRVKVVSIDSDKVTILLGERQFDISIKK